MSRFATVSLLQHLDLRPSYRELRFHLKAMLDEGDLDAMEFDLPSDAVVRSLHSRNDDLLRSDVIVTKGGQRRLRLVFDPGHRTQFIVDGTLLLPQSDSLIRTSLPRFALAPSTSIEWRFERNWWGISSPSDFRLETTSLDPESVNAISTDVYLQAWSDAFDVRHPELTIPQTQISFELREGTTPTFQLVPYQTRRRALQWKQTGSIGKRRLEWTLVGEIETTSSPTFQTVLLINHFLVSVLVIVNLLEDVLSNLSLVVSSGSSEVIKVTVKPFVDVLVDLIVVVTDFLGSLLLLDSLSLSCCAILISTTDVESVVAHESAISSKDICREHTPNDVTQVRHIVHVW